MRTVRLSLFVSFALGLLMAPIAVAGDPPEGIAWLEDLPKAFEEANHACECESEPRRRR